MVTIEDMKKCYDSNDDFKQYVDKCSRTYNCTIEDILQRPITSQYYQYLNKVGDYDERKSH